MKNVFRYLACVAEEKAIFLCISEHANIGVEETHCCMLELAEKNFMIIVFFGSEIYIKQF